MAIVDEFETIDAETEERGTAYTVSFDGNPTFTDRETAQQVAAEINEVLERHGGQ